MWGFFSFPLCIDLGLRSASIIHTHWGCLTKKKKKIFLVRTLFPQVYPASLHIIFFPQGRTCIEKWFFSQCFLLLKLLQGLLTYFPRYQEKIYWDFVLLLCLKEWHIDRHWRLVLISQASEKVIFSHLFLSIMQLTATFYCCTKLSLQLLVCLWRFKRDFVLGAVHLIFMSNHS